MPRQGTPANAGCAGVPCFASTTLHLFPLFSFLLLIRFQAAKMIWGNISLKYHFVLHNQNKQIGGLMGGSLSPSYNTFSRKRPEGGAVNRAGISE